MNKLLKALLALSIAFSSQLALAATVNINTADAKTLAANIIGVGEKRAEMIVAYRNEHGPFKSVDEMTQVKGIGLSLVEKNRENMTVKDQ